MVDFETELYGFCTDFSADNPYYSQFCNKYDRIAATVDKCKFSEEEALSSMRKYVKRAGLYFIKSIQFDKSVLTEQVINYVAGKIINKIKYDMLVCQ
jgi:hypothetical protein